MDAYQVPFSNKFNTFFSVTLLVFFPKKTSGKLRVIHDLSHLKDKSMVTFQKMNFPLSIDGR